MIGRACPTAQVADERLATQAVAGVSGYPTVARATFVRRTNPLRLEAWTGYSARSERAGDRGGSASPEALDLIEARFAERAQLYLEREVAILV